MKSGRRAALRMLGGVSLLAPFQNVQSRPPALTCDAEAPEFSDVSSAASSLMSDVEFGQRVHVDGVNCDAWLGALKSVSPAMKLKIQMEIDRSRRPVLDRLRDLMTRGQGFS